MILCVAQIPVNEWRSLTHYRTSQPTLHIVGRFISRSAQGTNSHVEGKTPLSPKIHC